MKYFFLLLTLLITGCGNSAYLEFSKHLTDTASIMMYLKEHNTSPEKLLDFYRSELASQKEGSKQRAALIYDATHKYVDSMTLLPANYLALVKMEMLHRTWQPASKAPYLNWELLKQMIQTEQMKLKQDWLLSDVKGDPVTTVDKLSNICDLMLLVKPENQEFPLIKEWQNTITLKSDLYQKLKHTRVPVYKSSVAFDESQYSKQLQMSCIQ